MLQQSLPFTVLKRTVVQAHSINSIVVLQQHLLFAVLKLKLTNIWHEFITRCNSTYRLRYAPKGARQQRSKATMKPAHLKYLSEAKVKQRWLGNSPYCLRYWNCVPITIAPCLVVLELQQYLPFTVLKLY